MKSKSRDRTLDSVAAPVVGFRPCGAGHHTDTAADRVCVASTGPGAYRTFPGRHNPSDQRQFCDHRLRTGHLRRRMAVQGNRDTGGRLLHIPTSVTGRGVRRHTGGEHGTHSYQSGPHLVPIRTLPRPGVPAHRRCVAHGVAVRGGLGSGGTVLPVYGSSVVREFVRGAVRTICGPVLANSLKQNHSGKEEKEDISVR